MVLYTGQKKKMKKLIMLDLAMVLVMTVLLVPASCSRENGLPDFSGNAIGIIHVDYVKSYENLGELAADADLIAIGTIDRTVEVVPDEATGDTGDPRARTYLTQSAFQVEKVLKGSAESEIVISQTGATGWAEEYGNPIFKPGEKYFLFLREGSDGIYYLLHPLGRYKISDSNIYSMNYVLPTGQSRPPPDLIFWKIDLDDFISRVTEEIPDYTR
jgi:hypothetical protein